MIIQLKHDPGPVIPKMRRKKESMKSFTSDAAFPGRYLPRLEIVLEGF